ERTTKYYNGDSIVTRNVPLSLSDNKNTNHRFNLRLEYQIDSMNSILYTPRLTLQHSESVTDDTSFSRSKTLSVAEYLAVTTKSKRTNERTGNTYQGELLFRHK